MRKDAGYQMDKQKLMMKILKKLLVESSLLVKGQARNLILERNYALVGLDWSPQNVNRFFLIFYFILFATWI